MTHKKVKLKIVLSAVILLIVFAFGWIGYEFWISYRNPKVTEYTFPTSKIESPVRILLCSDLHDCQFGEGNEELYSKIEEQNADAIFLLGDMINEDSENAHVALELVKRFSDKVPVYYALGNHEIGYMETHDDDLIKQLRDSGAVILDKAYADTEIGGQPLRIGGMYDYAFALDDNNTVDREHMKPGVYDFLTDFQSTDRLTLMLAHRPDSFIFGTASKTWNIDLVLSGHTHGGQVILPFAGGLWGGDQGWFPKYDFGMFRKDNINLIITRGLGSQKSRIPRFGSPPELVILTLQPT